MVGNEILKFIKEKGIKQRLIASKLGISPSLLSQYLNNEVRLPADTFFKICEFLEQPADRFKPSEEGREG
jgi:transcriptional regulator with XRE-family HTH domain